MNFTCNLCDCTLPLSYDRLKSENNLYSHFNGNRHRTNYQYNVGRSWTIDCNLCNMALVSYVCSSVDVFDHLYASVHLHNLSSKVSNQYYISSSDESSEEDTDYAEAEEEEYEGSYGYEPSYEEEESDLSFGEDEFESSDEVSHPSSSNHGNWSLFHCHVCNCKIPISIKSIQSSKEQIQQHITGKRHQDNLDDDNNTNSLGIQCNICQCNIPLSYNVTLSMQNISIHMDGNRHKQNLPPEENDKCYSSPIHVPD